MSPVPNDLYWISSGECENHPINWSPKIKFPFVIGVFYTVAIADESTTVVMASKCCCTNLIFNRINGAFIKSHLFLYSFFFNLVIFESFKK